MLINEAVLALKMSYKSVFQHQDFAASVVTSARFVCIWEKIKNRLQRNLHV